jgi:integrase
VCGGRDRIASPEEAAKLIAALPEPDQALWATAMYAGLRSGELQALTWENADLAAGLIQVERSYDPKEHCYVETKNRQHRRVPIATVLRDYLIAHKLRSGRSEGLCFPGSADLHSVEREETSSDGLEERETHRFARMPTHVRELDDRCRRQREGAELVHAPLLDHRHA